MYRRKCIPQQALSFKESGRIFKRYKVDFSEERYIALDCLRLIESDGTGIRKIYAPYKDCAVQPRIEVTTNTFKLVLPKEHRKQPKKPLW